MGINKKGIIGIGLCALFLISCYEEVLVIPDIKGFDERKIMFDQTIAAYDSETQFMLCPVDTSGMNDYQAHVSSIARRIDSINGKPVHKNEPFQFGVIQTDSTYSISWWEDSIGIKADLYFTTLPVIQIFTDESVPDEPKIVAQVVVSDPANDMPGIYSYAGIKMRGNNAMLQPKKSYRLELWEYENYGTGNDLPLLNMMADDDWILDAMFIDKARMRNRASFDVWETINDSRHEEEQDPWTRTYIEGSFVEVFLNGRYQGVYALNERFDRKRMGLAFSEGSLEGLIYKAEDWTGPTKYTGMEDKTGGDYWAGWELKYPKDYGDGVWEPFYNYLEFCMYTGDETFVNQVKDYLSLENVMDYYLFLNLTQAMDNQGKNIIMARYDSQSPFLFTPWDLDATWGRKWDGTLLGHDHLLSNALFDRLIELNPKNYRTRLKERWDELRENGLEQKTQKIFEHHYHLLVASGGLNRETQRWPQSELDLAHELEYIEEWSGKRFKFLDDYFEDLSSSIEDGTSNNDHSSQYSP